MSPHRTTAHFERSQPRVHADRLGVLDSRCSCVVAAGLSSRDPRVVGLWRRRGRRVDDGGKQKLAVMVAAIRTKGLAKSFGATAALRPLDLEVADGEVLGYLGPNGAGKTTTIRCLLGFVRATAGRAEIFGVDAQAHPAEAHRRLAYVPGEANLWPGLTGNETLYLLGRVQGHVDVAYRDELIWRFQLDPSKKVRAYSKGNRQKVLLIAALSSRADLLILDEPTTGLDPLMEQTFRECVGEARARGQAVFLCSHILSEV
jgi:ABC-2 type transport system ATP-binding protein